MARKMDQALLKIGKRSYLAYGWALTSPMMVVGGDGLIIIDPVMPRMRSGLTSMQRKTKARSRSALILLSSHDSTVWIAQRTKPRTLRRDR